MKNDIEKLLNKYEPDAIETALVQLFVVANNIQVKNNILLKNIIENQDESISSAKRQLKGNFEINNINDFVNIFELLVLPSEKKINGAFFTPQIITDFIVSETIVSPSQKICDPSCGCGAFLVAATILISEKFKKEVIKVIEENIYGVDIADYSVHRAKILLSLLALKNGEDKENIKFNIKTADSLVVDWKMLFPDIINNGGFDAIIGNPPYVKFQDLNKELRGKLYADWLTLKTGNYNLYFAFFELGVALMKVDGILGYITPNNYFTSLSGVHLREYLLSNRLIEKIIDFNHLKVFEAQTYTCITFLKNGENDFFSYERIDDCKIFDSLKDLRYSKVYFKELNNKKWRLLRDFDQGNIKKIENIRKKLGKIVDIRVGIATCKDSIYFINGSTLENDYYYKLYQEKKYPIEEGITQPIAKISDFKTQVDLDNNNRRIIFPYRKNNGKVEIIKESELKTYYPCCYEYFLKAKEELATRDKGKGKYPEWYAYARTQGLNFFGGKLLTPTFSSEPRFLLERNENALFCNGYAIYLINETNLFADIEQQLNLNILMKILNSHVMNYYIKLTSVSIEGGYPCYQKNFIELFGIPDFTLDELNFLTKEEDKVNIDDFLIKKYSLNLHNYPATESFRVNSKEILCEIFNG